MADFWDWLAQQGNPAAPAPTQLPTPDELAQLRVMQSRGMFPDIAAPARTVGGAVADSMIPEVYKPIPAEEWRQYDRDMQAALARGPDAKLPQSPADNFWRTPLGGGIETALALGGLEGPLLRGAIGGAKLAARGAQALGRGVEAAAFSRPMDWMMKAVPQGAGAFGGRLTQPALGAWAEPMTHSSEQLVESGLMPVLAGDKRISSRYPTAVARTEDPLTQQLMIDLPSYMRPTPRGDPFTQNMQLVTTYPGFAKFKDMPAEDVFRGAADQMAGNMQFIRENSPNAYLQRSPLWYEGANQIAGDLASRWGVPRQSASGALAALSPQKDWFQNVSNAERTGDILFGPAASRRMTSDMRNLHPTIDALNSPENMEIFRAIQGKSLQQVIDDPLKAAMWIRLYDEAHNAPGYRSITPEGMFGPPILTGEGVPARRAWNAGGEISKAVQSLLSGGDMNIISPAMGRANKVRSFYNNIELPWDRLYGDVTADTHQVAAGQLRPLSGNTYPVAHNFGNSLDPKFQGADFPGHASSSSFTGIGGTYPLSVEATRQFARDNQMLPRAGQSQAWEAVRELFPDTFKDVKKNVQTIDDIWRAHDRGEISLDDARRRILDFAAPGGIARPAWDEPGLAVARPTRASTYR